MQRKLKTGLLVFGMIASGLFADNLLDRVNERIFTLTDRPYVAFEWDGAFSQLNELNYSQLHSLKWGLIPLMMLMYFFWTSIITKTLFENRQFQRIALFFHVVVAGISSVLILLTRLFEWGELGQKLARSILEFILSPLATMILVAAFMLPFVQDGFRDSAESQE